MLETPVATEILSIPLDDIAQAQVRIAFGAGRLTLRPAEPGVLISGTFDGGVITRSKAAGLVELEQVDPHKAWLAGCERTWDVQLTARIPVYLRLETGANQSNIDLTSLRLPRVDLYTGASETNIQLPAVGETEMRINCGFASVNVVVPHGVAARISGKMALGAIDVDEQRFPCVGSGWESPHYDVTANRIDLEIEGGFGAVKVR